MVDGFAFFCLVVGESGFGVTSHSTRESMGNFPSNARVTST